MAIENVRKISISFAIVLIILLISTVSVELVLGPPPGYTGYTRQKQDGQMQNSKEELNTYNLKSFYMFASIGLVALISGFIIPVTFIGMGFILGGTFSLILVYYSYWYHLSSILKLISLIAALIILIIGSFIFTKKRHNK